MYKALQFVLYALTLTWPGSEPPQFIDEQPRKSIAIVGGGSAGLAVLKVLLDVEHETGADWDIVLYEQRRDVGGVWYALLHYQGTQRILMYDRYRLEDPNPPSPPSLPESPCYPILRTNTPHPTSECFA